MNTPMFANWPGESCYNNYHSPRILMHWLLITVDCMNQCRNAMHSLYRYTINRVTEMYISDHITNVHFHRITHETKCQYRTFNIHLDNHPLQFSWTQVCVHTSHLTSIHAHDVTINSHSIQWKMRGRCLFEPNLIVATVMLTAHISMQSNIHWTKIETEHLLISSHHWINWIIILNYWFVILDETPNSCEMPLRLVIGKIPRTKSSMRLATPYRNVMFVIHLKWDWLRAELGFYECRTCSICSRIQWPHPDLKLTLLLL